jgi:lipoprotein-releasing system permease protein
MYKVVLILKYLRKRRIAWVSLAAVTLCTAMVLVVISIMGGWLRMFLSTSQILEGDVIISGISDTGFGHYEEMLAALRKMPQVKAAAPEIATYGVVGFGHMDTEQYKAAIQVRAYGDLNDIAKINSFKKGLYRQYVEPMEEIEHDTSLSAAEKARREAELNAMPPSFDLPLDADAYREYLPHAKVDASKLPGLIAGTRLIIKPGPDGKDVRGDFIYTDWVKLSVGDVRSAETATPTVTTTTYWLVDDCRTNVYPIDRNTVYVPFDKLQKDLGMAAETYQEKVGDQFVDRVTPARVNEIQIGLNDGVDAAQARDAIEQVVAGIESKYLAPTDEYPVQVETWDEQQAGFTSAVIHEKVLLTFLFGIISIVAVFLVFCIFYMIVVEKTRDIGIIKSVGASNIGVAQIFLGYGLSLGLLGGGMGLLLAYLVVHNINELHAWLGREMKIVIWDPQTYIFNTIPNTMQSNDVTWIVSIAVLSALAGALVPAIRASRMNPVEALRWE